VANVLVALQRFARLSGDGGKAFSRSEVSIKGLGVLLARIPTKIAARIVAGIAGPGAGINPAGFARNQSEVALKLARFPYVPARPSELGALERIQQILIAIGAISRPVETSTPFLQPDAVAAGLHLPLSPFLLILGPLAVCALFRRCGPLFLRWRLRSSADSREALMRANPQANRGISGSYPSCVARRGPAPRAARHAMTVLDRAHRSAPARRLHTGSCPPLRSIDSQHNADGP